MTGLTTLDELFKDPEFNEKLGTLPQGNEIPMDDRELVNPQHTASQRAYAARANLNAIIDEVIKRHIHAIDSNAQRLLKSDIIPLHKQRGLVRALYAESEQSFIIHAVILGRVRQEDLEGTPLQGQVTFPIRSIAGFSGIYEDLLEAIKVPNARSPRRIIGKEPFASYAIGGFLGGKDSYTQNFFEIARYATKRLQEKILASKLP